MKYQWFFVYSEDETRFRVTKLQEDIALWIQPKFSAKQGKQIPRSKLSFC